MKFIELTIAKTIHCEEHKILLSVDKIIFTLKSENGGTYIEHV